MILEFCVSNYLSIKDELKISFVATALKDVLTESNDMITVPDTGLFVLRSAVIYGANASGKSNFVRALDFMRRVTIMGSRAMRYDDRFFRIDPVCKEKPGVFQIDFVAEQTVFSYGFAINYLTHEFCAEWLYRRKKLVFLSENTESKLQQTCD
mgnify:CR=1 FL=1